MADPGVDVIVEDEPLGGEEANRTDQAFLLSLDAPSGFATPVPKTRADTGDDDIDAALRAYFAAGGQAITVQGWQATPSTLPGLAAAVALLPPGPGQVLAPEAVSSVNHRVVGPAAWAQNKVALLNGPSGASESALLALSTADRASGADMRAAGLWADWESWADPAGGAPHNVPATVAVAGMIARNDRLYRNPNIAAAGSRGRSQSSGLLAPAPRSEASITTLKNAQVNSGKVFGSEVRNYGFRTLADLSVIPHWFDFSGARTIMAFRALAAGADEEIVFDQIDGKRTLQDRYEGSLRQVLKGLYDAGALFGDNPDAAYHVDVGPSVNPVSELAQGRIAATVRVRVSTFAEHVITTIARRPLTASLTI
jgi:hypothetical protein